MHVTFILKMHLKYIFICICKMHVDEFNVDRSANIWKRHRVLPKMIVIFKIPLNIFDTKFNFLNQNEIEYKIDIY